MGTSGLRFIYTEDGDRLGFYCGQKCPLAYKPYDNYKRSARVRILREKSWSGRTEISLMAESPPRLYSLVVTYDTGLKCSGTY